MVGSHRDLPRVSYRGQHHIHTIPLLLPHYLLRPGTTLLCLFLCDLEALQPNSITILAALRLFVRGVLGRETVGGALQTLIQLEVLLRRPVLRMRVFPHF